MAASLVIAVAAGTCASPRAGLNGYTGGNMNGKYQVWSGKPQAPWNDDYASKGYEYFDVWAPEIATVYGEVFWTSQGNQPIPPGIVERFKGKTMAIVGYEQDQVMVNPVGQPGVNPDQDVSVPINWAYNHHYMAWMTSDDSEMVEVIAKPGDTSAHGAPTKWMAVDKPSAAFRANPDIPTSQMFSEGNGGESRKSFHGYPAGYAQLIDSPTEWHITPMQIDTRNRECGATPAHINNCTRFTPWLEPKQARYGRGIPEGTNYSGVLECPCNSRFGGDPEFYPTAGTKEMNVHKFNTLNSGTCGVNAVVNQGDCYDAVVSIGINATSFVNKTVADPTKPVGCSVTSSADGVATVTFNSAQSGAACPSETIKVGQASFITGVTLGLRTNVNSGSAVMRRGKKGTFCEDNRVNVLSTFDVSGTSTNVTANNDALTACEKYCLATPACTVCSIDQYRSQPDMDRWVALPQCGNVGSFHGVLAGDISNKVFAGEVNITVSGPSSVWFGVGFDATVMGDSPYTLIVNESGVMEQHLGTCGSEAEHCPGNTLKSMAQVLSNTVVGGVRTVVITRPLAGRTKEYYSFNLDTQSTIPIITAIGTSQVFAIHQAHGDGVISMTNEAGIATCVCDGGAQGALCSGNFTGCKSFTKNCVAPPAGSLLAQKNPTCNSKQYSGGLTCCGHQRIMLDADQDPGTDLLRYHMKFRFWFQEYTPAVNGKRASHSDLPRIYYQTEANAGEYDIPPAFALPNNPVVGYPDWPVGKPTPGTTCTGTCPDGPDCECVHQIRFNFSMSNTRLVYAGGHCHAPACKFIELWASINGSDTLLCHQLPVYGQGDVSNDKYDEAGYLALPPCLWGKDEGLIPGVWIPENTPMWSIKQNYNTHSGHFGEMASWQMRGVNFPEE